MLIELQDLKTYLKITGSELDDFLTDAIEKVSETLNTVTNRRLEYSQEQEYYIGSGLEYIFTKNFPVAAVQSVKVFNKNGDYTYASLFDPPDTVEDSLLIQKHGERLLLKKGYVFPKDRFIELNYTWGYDITQSGEYKTPEDLQAAVIQLAAEYYFKSPQGDSRLGVSARDVGGAATTGMKFEPVDLSYIVKKYRRINI